MGEWKFVQMGVFVLFVLGFYGPVNNEVMSSRSVNSSKNTRQFSNIFSTYLLNHWSNQSQIWFGAFMGWGNERMLNGLSHMTKIAPMPIYGENFKNLLQNWMAKTIETLYIALSTRVLPSRWQMMTPGWPLIFYVKVHFGSLCICMRKCLNFGLLRHYWCQWYESWYMSIKYKLMNSRSYTCASSQGHSLIFVKSYLYFR